MSTTEALADFLHDLGAALVRLAEGLDDRPRATVCHLPTPTASWPEAPVHECPDCGLMFGTPSGLGAHRRSVHARTPIPPRPVDVALPGAIGEADDDAPSATPPPTVAEGAPSPSDDGASVPCPDCGRKFRSNNALGIHRARSHGWRSPTSGASQRRGERARPKADPNSRRRPTPCPSGCGRIFDWAPAAAAHGRHCDGPALDAIPVDVPPAPEPLATIVWDNQLANQGRGDDLDRTEADGGQPTLAPGAPDGPVGHDHGGAPSEPRPADQRTQGSAPPGSAPTSEELDPLDPGRLRYRCPDCGIEHDERINANAHRRRLGHGEPVKFTAPTRSRA